MLLIFGLKPNRPKKPNRSKPSYEVSFRIVPGSGSFNNDFGILHITVPDSVSNSSSMSNTSALSYQ